MTTIAVSGAGSFLGRKICQSLALRSPGDSVVILDQKKPNVTADNIHYIRTTFKRPFQDTYQAQLKKDVPDVLLLCTAVDEVPVAGQHESGFEQLQDSLRILRTCLDLGVRRIVLHSSASVYGAHFDNPAFLDESMTVRGDQTDPSLRNLIILEEAVNTAMATRGAASSLAIIRPAWVLGPTVKNLLTQWLSLPILPMYLGFDPVIQVVHEDDLLIAIYKMIDSEVFGIFNCAADGFTTINQLATRVGKKSLPLFHTALSVVGNFLWQNSVSPFPASFLTRLRYRLVLDTTALREQIAFSPRYSIEKTVNDFVRRIK